MPSAVALTRDNSTTNRAVHMVVILRDPGITVLWIIIPKLRGKCWRVPIVELVLRVGERVPEGLLLLLVLVVAAHHRGVRA